jgi:hypothetical protein
LRKNGVTEDPEILDQDASAMRIDVGVGRLDLAPIRYLPGLEVLEKEERRWA